MTNRKESVTFKPWSGRSYAEGIEDKKVLVLGESHYHSCDDDPACRDLRDLEQNLRHAGLTKEVVDWWRDKPHRSPVSHRVPALFGLNKTEFWDRVAFYNFCKHSLAQQLDLGQAKNNGLTLKTQGLFNRYLTNLNRIAFSY